MNLAHLAGAVAEGVRVCAGIGAAFFAVAAVLAVIEAQAAVGAGRPDGLVRAGEKIVPGLVLLAIGLNAGAMAEAVAAQAPPATAPDVARLFWSLTRYVLSAAVLSGAAFFLVGIVTGAFDLLLASVTGRYRALPTIWERLLAVVVLGGTAGVALRILDEIYVAMGFVPLS